MAVTYAYGLHPWVWADDAKTHNPPVGAVSSLDLRPLAEQARAGQSGGWGFFAWLDSPPADLVSLGAGDCREIQPTVAQRAELRLKLGLSTNPSGTFLTDVLADVLGRLSDPTGENGPKPIMPTRDGNLELCLSAHSRVWSSRYEAQQTLAANPTGRANRIREVIRAQLLDGFNSGGTELVAKMLGGVLLRHGYARSEVRDGAAAKRAEWTRLLPTGLLAKLGGGGFKPKRPTTSYSDNFDDNTLTNWLILNGLWTEGNQTLYISSTSGRTHAIYLNLDVSSSDHTVQSYRSAQISSRVPPGVLARLSGTNASNCTYYGVALRGSSSDMWKRIGGTQTILTNPAGTTAAQIQKIVVSGSSISGYQGAGGTTLMATVTDTAISSGTKGGVGHRDLSSAYVGSTIWVDNFLIDDGLTAGSIGPCLGNTGKTIGGRIFSGSILQ